MNEPWHAMLSTIQSLVEALENTLPVFLGAIALAWKMLWLVVLMYGSR